MKLSDVWNGWKIEEEIGEGSFGKVYKITREDFGSTYVAALKVIHIPHSPAEVEIVRSEGMTEESVTTYFYSMVEDLVKEFDIMYKLKGNTNIVSYEDHAILPVEDGFGWDIYIRMELLTPLLEYIKVNPLSTNKVIQLGIDLCQALELCQKNNIIHRDIKPENIFVSSVGAFKLGDFGIARQLEKSTIALSKKRTYSYMAPEVYQGHHYDATVDIYSLGIVLYRFLNKNRTPFLPAYPEPIRYYDRENANILRLSGKEMPKPCDASDELSKIILKACTHDPKNRYQDPREMCKDLEKLLKIEADKKIDLSVVDTKISTVNEDSMSDSIQDVEVNPTVVLFPCKPTDIILKGKVILSGNTIQANEFHFELYETIQGNNILLSHTENDSYGNIVFPKIQYKETGEHHYIIKQIDDEKIGFVYDDAQISTLIKVKDNGDYQLITETDEFINKIIFNNSYKPLNTHFDIKGRMILNGKELTYGQFSFEIYENENKISTGINDAYGNIHFSEINFGEVGKHQYIIKQKNDSQTGVTYDENIIELNVDVIDDQGQLKAQVFQNQDDMTFINTYKPLPTTYLLDGEIQLKDSKLKEKQFRYEVYENNQLVTVGTNDKKGIIHFDEMRYDSAGLHLYVIKQVNDNQNNIDYDTTEYQQSIEIVDNNGQLTACLVAPLSIVVFHNVDNTKAVALLKKTRKRKTKKRKKTTAN